MRTAFVCLLLWVCVCLAASGSVLAKLPVRSTDALTGHFVFERGAGRDVIGVDLLVTRLSTDQFTVSVSAGHPADGHGPAPDGGGAGAVGSDGVLRFTYEDSFSNRGAGTFQRVGAGRYRLTVDLTEVSDPRCLTFYGEHTGRRVPKRHHPARSLTRRSSERLWPSNAHSPCYVHPGQSRRSACIR